MNASGLRRSLLAAAVFLACVLLPDVASAQSANPATASVLVMPLRPTGDDPRGVWLGEGVALLVSDGLTALGRPAVTRTDRVAAFDALELPDDRELSRATLLRAAQVMGVRELVTGTVTVTGDTLTVSVRVVQVEVGRGVPELREQGSLRDVVALASRVAARIAGVPPGSPAATIEPPPSLEVFEAFVKGLVAETPATQLRFLAQAVKAAPTYARAQLALWEVSTEEEMHDEALAAAQAVPASSRFSRRARFSAGLSLIALKRWDDAFAAFKTLLDESPTPAVYNNLGVIQARRGAVTPQTGKPAWYFTKAAEAAPESPDYFFNLGYAYWLDKDVPAAVYWLREVVRRRPADGEAHFVLAAALQAVNSGAESTRERELARQLSSRFDEWEKGGAADGERGVPRGLERPSETETTPVRVDPALVSATQQEYQQLARFHYDRGQRLAEQQQDREAISEFRKSLYLAPYDARTHLAMARVLVRGGRLREAVDALKISLWSEESVDARLLLAESLLESDEPAAALTHAERAVQLAPTSADARALLAKIKAVLPAK
ncbi:MAG TPA: tetratricopeptide repeat protein [Luteitalea sp.]|nr:tetratricopeptide repeat protein [Luteitalea sp.]